MKKLSIKPRVAITGLLLVTALLSSGTAVLVMQHASTKSPNPSEKLTSTKTSPASQFASAQIYSIGQPVAFATETVTINSARTATSLSASYSSPQIADAGSKFIVVNMTLTNTTAAPFVYNPFSLVDQKDRLYQTYPNAVFAVDDYLTNQSLQPGVPHTGSEVYQVPIDDTEFRIGGYVGNSSTIRLVKFTPTN